MNKSMNKLNQMLSTNQGEISSTVENLKVVSQDLREVSNNAKKYPSMLIFGDAPNAPIYGKNR
jgi:phospholipid/cholesterol/gamma-HCH transport system substrate-binding protein/paraquat-inducible protein B